MTATENGATPAHRSGEDGGNAVVRRAGQVVEEGDVSGEEVALGREVGVAKPIEPRLVLRLEGEGDDQRRPVASRIEHWLDLTKRIPAWATARPSMADPF